MHISSRLQAEYVEKILAFIALIQAPYSPLRAIVRGLKSIGGWDDGMWIPELLGKKSLILYDNSFPLNDGRGTDMMHQGICQASWFLIFVSGGYFPHRIL